MQRKLPKNILLEASNNPSTIEELSVELGTAAPYMEEEAELLVDATLLKKIGNKYVTDFVILSRECQLQLYQAQRRTSKERSAMINTIVDESLEKIRSLGIVRGTMSDDDLKWWVVMYAVDYFLTCLEGCRGEWPEKRANGEDWGFLGFEEAHLPENCRSGNNGYGDARTAMFHTYKISDYDMWNRAGEMYYAETLFLGDVISNNRKVSSFTEAERRIWGGIENRFAHAEEDGSVVPDILVMDKKVLEEIHGILKSHRLYGKVMEDIQAAFDEVICILKNNNSPVLERQLAYCATMVIFDIRMMTVHDEVESGGLAVPADPGHSRAAMWMVLG